MPYMLTLAAGAMIYVICDELIPESKENNNKIGVISVVFGLLVMLLLDILFA